MLRPWLLLQWWQIVVVGSMTMEADISEVEAVIADSGVPPETTPPWGVSPVVTTALIVETYSPSPPVDIQDATATNSTSSRTVSSATNTAASSAPGTSRNRSTYYAMQEDDLT
nr:hypothetical protein Iba_chr07bCG6460 [Ipomoea batatas]